MAGSERLFPDGFGTLEKLQRLRVLLPHAPDAAQVLEGYREVEIVQAVLFFRHVEGPLGQGLCTVDIALIEVEVSQVPNQADRKEVVRLQRLIGYREPALKLEQGGIEVAPFLAEQAYVQLAPGHHRVFSPQRFFVNLQRLLDVLLSLSVIALGSVDQPEMLERKGCLRVFPAERLLIDAQSALQRRLRICIVASRAQHESQARRQKTNVSIVGSGGRLSQVQGALRQFDGFFVLAGLVLRHGLST